MIEVLAAASSGTSTGTWLSLLVALGSSGVAVAAFLASRSRDSTSNLTERIVMIVHEGIAPINDRLSILETKIDVFWRNVAFDAAKILHSPHISRKELDGLLEAFHKQDAMTESQIVDLGLKLTEIRDSITGQVMDGQPTLAGDRMAAAIILQVMDQRDLAVQDIGHPQDALILVDPAGVISFISLEAERLTGYREDELRGVPIEILVPDEMHEEHDKLRDGYMQHPEVRVMGVEKSCLLLRRKDGTVIPVWIDLAPTVLGPTKETFVIATIRPRTGGGADGAK